jgi:hypothetical protein
MKEHLANRSRPHPHLMQIMAANEEARARWQAMDQKEQKRKLALANGEEKSRRHRQDRIKASLDRFAEGDIDAWWRLFWNLHIRADGRTYKNPFWLPVTSTPGWKEADEATRERFKNAALRFLKEYPPEFEWIGTDVKQYPELAGFLALDFLFEIQPIALETLDAETWRKWAPVTSLELSATVEARRDRHIQLIRSAYGYAPEAYISVLKRQTEKSLQQGYGLPYVLTAHDLHLVYDIQVWEMLLSLADSPGFTKEYQLVIYELILNATRVEEPPDIYEVHSKTYQRLAKLLDDPQIAVRVAHILFGNARGAAWDLLWPLICENDEFGRQWAEGAGSRWFFTERSLRDLDAGQLASLYEWLVTRYPSKEDPQIAGVHTPSRREEIGRWRDSVFSQLTKHESQEALETLYQLATKHPNLSWLRSHTIPRIEEVIRSRTWGMEKPRSLLELIGSADRRIVRSVGELRTVILEALDVLQKRMCDEAIPEVEFLWDDDPRHKSEPLRGRPKTEEALSNYVAAHLYRELEHRRIVVNREVQVHHEHDRLDIRVEAYPESDTVSAVTVVIEVKGCWNKQINEALDNQLVGRYLRKNESWQGIYLVGWYVCEFWGSDVRKNEARRLSKSEEDLRDRLQSQVSSLKENGDFRTHFFILNATRQARPSRIMP